MHQVGRFALLAIWTTIAPTASAQTSVDPAIRKGAALPTFDAPAGRGDLWNGIVNGTVTDRHPAVGALLRTQADGRARNEEHCSGTLVGCRYMLTAAHCIKGDDPSKRDDPNTYDPSTFLAWFQATGPRRVKKVERDGRYRDCPGAPHVICSKADLALVELEEPIEGIRSLPITRTTVVPAGDLGTIIGFGVTAGDRSDYGIKRMGTVRSSRCKDSIDNAQDDAWICWQYLSTVGSNTCGGDSGGPFIASNGAVAGVTSTGMKRNCDKGDEGFDTRVSSFTDWLIKRAGHELQAGACGRGAQAGDMDAPTVMLVNEQYVPNGDGVTHAARVTTPAARITLAAQGVGRDFSAIRNVVIRARALSRQVWDTQCKTTVVANLAFCEIRNPEPGEWEILVAFDSTRANSDQPFVYQLTATLYRR